MSLDFHLVRVQPCDVFDLNITHNLADMAREAGVYKTLWRSEELPEGTTAADILPLVEAAIAAMRADPERFKEHNPPNGWGSYSGFLDALCRLAEACREYPDATLRSWR